MGSTEQATMMEAGMARLLYGPVLMEAAASGDLEEMERVAKEAEYYLREAGDVSAALEGLKLEIAKVKAKKK